MKAEDILLSLRQTGPKLDYHGRTIEGNLNFFELPPRPGPSGNEEIVITRELDFRGAIFNSVATWDQGKELTDQPRVRFAKGLDCRGARFQDAVSLDRAVFSEDATFGGAHFNKMASFTEAVFEKRAGFREAQFDERALFTKVKFHGETDFGIATFHWLAFFSDSTFCYQPKEGANFLYTRFNGDAVFARVNFKGIARFIGTHFRGPAYFSDTNFEDEAWFAGGTRFDDIVTFRRGRFSRIGLGAPEPGKPKRRAPVVFQGVVFSADANFSDAEFGEVDFGQTQWAKADIGADTTFRRNADFRAATFRSLSLRRVVFESAIGLSLSNLGNRVDVTDVDIRRASMHITWKQLHDSKGKPKFVWQGVFDETGFHRKGGGNRIEFFSFLETLENGFRANGELGEAGDVHYFAEDLKRLEKNSPCREFDTVLLKWVYGYGVSPWHQVWIALASIVGFALVYGRPGALLHKPSGKRTLWLWLTEIPVDWSTRTKGASDPFSLRGFPRSLARRWWRSLSFSFYVFTRLGRAEVLARRSYAGVVITERLIGGAVWIIFLINLANVWPLLHRLVAATAS